MASSLWSDTRWTKVRRDLRLHPSRTILVVLAMVIGLAGAGAVLDTWALMRLVTREEYRLSRPASATLRVTTATNDATAADGLTSALVATVRARGDVAAVQARRTVTATLRRQGDVVTRTLVLFALDDPTNQQIGTIVTQSGDWPARDGGIVIEHSSMEYAGLQPGDTILAAVGERGAIALPVSGVARDVGLPPGWMEHVVYAFVTPATLARLGASPTFNELQVVVRDSTLNRDGVRRVAYDIKRTLESAGLRVSNVDVPVPGEHQHAAQINSLLFTQGAFGALALLLSGVLVVNLIAAMLAGQVREIGVMKAIGASAGDIARMYLVAAFALGVVACAIAIPLAAVVGRAYADFTAQLLNFSTSGFRIPLSIFAWQVAVGLCLPVAAAAIPIMRGCRLSVANALRDVGISAQSAATTNGWVSNAIARTGTSRPLLFSLRNAFRRKQRMVLTLLTLAMGGAVFMGARNLETAVRGAVDVLFGTQHYDLGVRLTRAWPVDSLEPVVRAVSGVGAAEAWGSARATLEHADSTQGNAFPISTVPPNTALLEHRTLDGRWLRAGDTRAIIVNKRLVADEPWLRVGSAVTLQLAGRASAWTVVGVVESGPSAQAFATREAIAQAMGEAGVDRLVVQSALSGPASQLELMQRVRAALPEHGMPVQSGQLMSEARAVVEDHLLMVAGFLGIMGQLMIVVGGLALTSTMGMAVLERTREIGVMRAIGARHGAILRMVQVEGLVIALCGWLLAIPLSAPMSIALGNAFGRIMLPVATHYLPDARGVAVWLVVAVIVSLLACAAPAWRAMRITTKDALAYE
jgi:putative ABC transport system permease protein